MHELGTEDLQLLPVLWKGCEVGMTIEEWAKDFKSYVNELQMPRDDYKGIMSYIDDAIALLEEQEAKIEHLKRPDCEHAEHDGIGCLGYCGCAQDDEPIETCKRCEKYTGNVYEALSVKTKETDV